MGDISKMLKWFKDRERKVVYDNARPWGFGSPAQYDCSAAVIEGLRAGGFIADGPKIGWTGSLRAEILPKIARQISRGECRRGDIFISNWNAFEGHTGVFLENNTIIHCNAGDMTIATTVADGRMGYAPYEYYRLTNSSDSNTDNIYTGGSLTMPDSYGSTISQENIRLVIKYAKQYNIRPSFMVNQMLQESYWGHPAVSIVGSRDNNWSGISEPFRVPSDLGISMSRGSARPVNEGGYYVHFNTLEDYFKAYAFMLSERNGLYFVQGVNTIGDFYKGLFKIGGANADYAGVGFYTYSSQGTELYRVLKRLFPNQLNEMDSAAPGSGEEPDITSLKKYTINEVKLINNIWQIRCNSLVPVDFDWTDNGIATADIILVDSNGKPLADQNTIKNGMLFVFNYRNFLGVYDTIQANGGYYWSRVSLKFSGVIWLNVWNRDQLLFGGTGGSSGSGNSSMNPLVGTFYPSMRLPVSGDTDPNSPALAYYEVGEAILYDSYTFENGYAWISYIAVSGLRRYIAVGPNDGRADTVWGTGFFDGGANNSGNVWGMSGIFYPSKKLPVSGDTNPSSPALAYYDAGEAIPYDSYVFVNGYAWISYIAGSGLRRYIAVGPDDGRIDTVWGKGFFN